MYMVPLCMCVCMSCSFLTLCSCPASTSHAPKQQQASPLHLSTHLFSIQPHESKGHFIFSLLPPAVLIMRGEEWGGASREQVWLLFIMAVTLGSDGGDQAQTSTDQQPPTFIFCIVLSPHTCHLKCFVVPFFPFLIVDFPAGAVTFYNVAFCKWRQRRRTIIGQKTTQQTGTSMKVAEK